MTKITITIGKTIHVIERMRPISVALQISDVDVVKIAGLLFEAGSVSSPVLIQVGDKGSSANHVANPISLHDLYFRVGGDALALAEVCIEINSYNRPLYLHQV